jgi:transposase InsO family protein
MPWREVSVMDQRREFAHLAMQEGVNRRELCRRFGISPDVGYKWLARQQAGDTELADRSRRPHGSPGRTDTAIEVQVLAVRDAHPAWGARKIARCLELDGVQVPVVSTVHEILRRNGRIIPPPGGAAQIYQRFEKEAPNQLWQMDFKGRMVLANGASCHPLTMIDDHSRYALCIGACANEQRLTVQQQLTNTFRRYGLPDALFVDNGSPWGDSGGSRWSGLRVWLLRLSVDVIYARPFHPQSRGKNERFHRTLKAEVFATTRFADLSPGCSAPSMPGAPSTIWNVPMRPSIWTFRPTVISPARGRCRTSPPRSNMPATKSCAASPPILTSASRADDGACQKPFVASVLLSGPKARTATTEFSSVAARSAKST